MSRRPFRIGRSLTGLGFVGHRLIKKRTRIVEYKGPLLTGKDAERAETRGNRYLFEINSRWTIDGKSRKNIARYANHSCNPNADPIIVKRRVFINALRDIKPGEEITYSYGKRLSPERDRQVELQMQPMPPPKSKESAGAKAKNEAKGPAIPTDQGFIRNFHRCYGSS